MGNFARKGGQGAFQNQNNGEFTERRGIVVANPHFSDSICRPVKTNADSKMTKTLKSSCPTPNVNHLPDYADKYAISNDLFIEDVSDTEDTKTDETNTNHLPDQYADKSAIANDLIIEDVEY